MSRETWEETAAQYRGFNKNVLPPTSEQDQRPDLPTAEASWRPRRIKKIGKDLQVLPQFPRQGSHHPRTQAKGALHHPQSCGAGTLKFPARNGNDLFIEIQDTHVTGTNSALLITVVKPSNILMKLDSNNGMVRSCQRCPAFCHADSRAALMLQAAIVFCR